MWDSFMTWRCEGAKAVVSFSVMDASTGSILSCDDELLEVVMLIRWRPETADTGTTGQVE
jgi:hypothetical protein